MYSYLNTLWLLYIDCHLIIANIIYFLIYFMKKKNIIDFNQHFMLSFQ